MIKVIILLMVIVLACFPAKAQLLPDDHGDTLFTATALTGPSNVLSGVFEHELDVDVFSFPVQPWTTYTISIATGTTWGVEVDVMPPAGVSVLWSTNSVWAGVATLNAPYHEGALARWYIRIRPLFAFTSGSYDLTVRADVGQDTNANGFPDAWELAYFGNLGTANPALHEEVFRTGRAPGDPLAIDALSTTSGADVVSWSLAVHGTYDLYSSTNLMNPSGWQYEETYRAGSEGGPIGWTNPAVSLSTQFYQVRFRNE
jgi:hypothetical protein